jgi:hypothetical protein
MENVNLEGEAKLLPKFFPVLNLVIKFNSAGQLSAIRTPTRLAFWRRTIINELNATSSTPRLSSCAPFDR